MNATYGALGNNGTSIACGPTVSRRSVSPTHARAPRWPNRPARLLTDGVLLMTLRTRVIGRVTGPSGNPGSVSSCVFLTRFAFGGGDTFTTTGTAAPTSASSSSSSNSSWASGSALSSPTGIAGASGTAGACRPSTSPPSTSIATDERCRGANQKLAARSDAAGVLLHVRRPSVAALRVATVQSHSRTVAQLQYVVGSGRLAPGGIFFVIIWAIFRGGWMWQARTRWPCCRGVVTTCPGGWGVARAPVSPQVNRSP